jgi:hypothetical protein
MHTGGTTALCVPKFRRDDGDWWTSSLGQQWLWDEWQKMWGHFGEMKVRLNLPLIVFFNGELVDDNWHKTSQLVSTNHADQQRLARAVLEPATDVADDIIALRGTEAHSGTNGEWDEMVAESIGAVPDSEGRFARWRFSESIGGVLFDVAHHPGVGGGKGWNKGKGAVTLGHRVIHEYLENGQEAPHLIVRNHNHVKEDSGDNLFTRTRRTRAYILPGWQLPTAFTYRINGGVLPVGGLVATVDDGEWDAEMYVKYLEPKDEERKWI